MSKKDDVQALQQNARRPVLRKAAFEARASAANRKVMKGQYRAACGRQAVLPVAAQMGSPAKDASMRWSRRRVCGNRRANKCTAQIAIQSVIRSEE